MVAAHWHTHDQSPANARDIADAAEAMDAVHDAAAPNAPQKDIAADANNPHCCHLHPVAPKNHHSDPHIFRHRDDDASCVCTAW